MILLGHVKTLKIIHFLEINGINENNQTIKYEVPLKIEDTCSCINYFIFKTNFISFTSFTLRSCLSASSISFK